MPAAARCYQGAMDIIALADRWTDTGGGGQQEVWAVSEGAVLLATREYTLRLPPGAVWVSDAGEARCAVRAAPGSAPFLLRAACDSPTLLPQLHDPGSELARALLPGMATACADDVFERAWHAERECDALIERCNGRSQARRREQYVRLARARAVLAWSERAPLDVVRVAQIARLSPHYFVELFHRVFGASPHRYRIDRRMQEARRLVAHTRQPIREILNQLGLDSHSTFTRVFRNRFGMSATSLREAAAAGRLARE